MPTGPEIRFGYIEPAAAERRRFSVACFVENPDVATAQASLEYGSFLWNSGMFHTRASI